MQAQPAQLSQAAELVTQPAGKLKPRQAEFPNPAGGTENAAPVAGCGGGGRIPSVQGPTRVVEILLEGEQRLYFGVETGACYGGGEGGAERYQEENTSR